MSRLGAPPGRNLSATSGKIVVPPSHTDVMPKTTSLLVFSRMAESVGLWARTKGMQVPNFQSPPRNDLMRSLRRHPSGSTTVLVRVRDRATSAVALDLVEGVVVANALVGSAADSARSEILSLLGEYLDGEVPGIAHATRSNPPTTRRAAA